VDFPSVVIQKTRIIVENNLLAEEALEFGKENTDLHVGNYSLLAADLSNLPALLEKLKNISINFLYPIY
jgi:hypothetical protein